MFWKFQLEGNTFERETHQPERKHPLPTDSGRYLDFLLEGNIDSKKCLLIA